VADYLITQHGFDPNRFVVIGNGQDKPIEDNTSEEGRAKNRRTDFELIPQ
jgi:NitT/TauT family transport system substrate-binding protein